MKRLLLAILCSNQQLEMQSEVMFWKQKRMREVYSMKVDWRDSNIKMITETVLIEREVSQGIGFRRRKRSR